MELTIESMVAAGYSEAQAKEVLAAHRAALNGRFIPKDRFDEMNTQWEQRLQEAQAAKEKAFQDARAELQAARTQDEMKARLNGQAHDPDLVISLLDMSKISRDESGKLSGYDDQVSALRQSKPFLFLEDHGDEGGQKDVDSKGKMHISGSTPPDGQKLNPQKKMSEGERLARSLAERRLKERQALQASENVYFKG